MDILVEYVIEMNHMMDNIFIQYVIPSIPTLALLAIHFDHYYHHDMHYTLQIRSYKHKINVLVLCAFLSLLIPAATYVHIDDGWAYFNFLLDMVKVMIVLMLLGKKYYITY